MKIKSLHLWLNSKRRAKFTKAASSNEVSDKRALAKLSLNFRNSSKPPIFVGNPRWASPTHACPFFFYLIIHYVHKSLLTPLWRSGVEPIHIVYCI